MTTPPLVTPELLDAIDARANAATPGPWDAQEISEPSDDAERATSTLYMVTGVDEGGAVDLLDQLVEGFGQGFASVHDAAHAAGMDPVTTLALTSHIRNLHYEAGMRDQLVADLEAQVAQLRAERDAALTGWAGGA